MSEARRMNHFQEGRLSWLLLVLLLWGWNAIAQSPQDWLERMAGASEKFNYQGTFVHMCDGQMDIVRIVHRVQDGQVSERITAESSNGRQIIRDADEVMCIFPDQKKVIVESRGTSSAPIGAKKPVFPSFANISQSLYEVTLLGSDQVAEQDTVVLMIHPVDDYRYGYRLWLDRRTAVPLKFELVDSAGQGLEHGVFTEIQFFDSLSAKDIAPTMETDGFVWERSTTSEGSAVGAGQQEDLVSSQWHAETLPPGFGLVLVEAKEVGSSATQAEQLIYSDGLATISVFIEAYVEPAEQVEGQSKIGATNVFTTITDGYVITAMGGVPVDTAQMVALSVTSR